MVDLADLVSFSASPMSYGGYEYILFVLFDKYQDEIEWLVCQSQMDEDEPDNDVEFSVAVFHKMFRQIPVTGDSTVDKVIWIAIGESDKFRKLLYETRMGKQ